MSDKNESVFPVKNLKSIGDVVDCQESGGLTKRELFAAMAMQSYLSCAPSTEDKVIAVASVGVADDLIAELKIKPSEPGVQRLKLKVNLFGSVLNGDKTATTRKGLKKYILGNAEFYDPDLSIVRPVPIFITKVRHELWGAVRTGGAALCHHEGYDSLSEFHDAIVGIYGSLEETQPMTIIYFKLR